MALDGPWRSRTRAQRVEAVDGRGRGEGVEVPAVVAIAIVLTIKGPASDSRATWVM